MFVAWRQVREIQEESSDAGHFWDAGRKADAVSKYRAVLYRDVPNLPDGLMRAVVYLRVIDHDVEHGNADSARAFVVKADREGIDLRPEKEGTRKLVTLTRAHRSSGKRRNGFGEKRRRIDEKMGERMPPSVGQTYRDSGHVLPNSDRFDTRMGCVDWTNLGNRPIRGLTAKIVGYDPSGRGVEVLPVPAYYT
jgi:hypothetical protein